MLPAASCDTAPTAAVNRVAVYRGSALVLHRVERMYANPRHRSISITTFLYPSRYPTVRRTKVMISWTSRSLLPCAFPTIRILRCASAAAAGAGQQTVSHAFSALPFNHAHIVVVRTLPIRPLSGSSRTSTAHLSTSNLECAHDRGWKLCLNWSKPAALSQHQTSTPSPNQQGHDLKKRPI